MKKTTREKNMEEMLISLTGGGFVAIILCTILPAIETRMDVFVFFIFFWFMTTVIIWNGFDIRDRLEEARRTGGDIWECIFSQRHGGRGM